MAIKLKNPETRPAMLMDGLHVDQLLLRIDRSNGLKSINAQGVTYGVDGIGNQVYNSTNMKVAEGNFSSAVVEWAMQNGHAVDVQDAATQLQEAKALLVANPASVFTLMAYFEQATGAIFEIAGKAEVAVIE